MIANDLITDLPWDVPPLCFLSLEQQVQFKQAAEIRRYSLGEMPWSTDSSGSQMVIVAGRVRLVPEESESMMLKPGDWLGDCVELPGFWKARAADKEVTVAVWSTDQWRAIASRELDQFWAVQRQRYLPQTSDTPKPVTGFPFVPGVNTAAACLTMATNHLQNSAQMEWVQRQLRGQTPADVVEAAEKVGLQLRRVETRWSELRQLGLPALMQWQDNTAEPSANGNFPTTLPASPRSRSAASSAPHWVLVYATRGDRLIVADPLNPTQSCESVPRSLVEANWDGQLWQIELVQKQERFSLAWFLPAVMKYRGLLMEVLLASFTLQLLGLTTPVITQVVIDKVMVQGSIPTLDVMAIALLGVAFFEAFLGILRLFIFTHTARRLDLSLSAQLFRHLMRLPLSYFEARRVGDTVARVQELENIRQFLTGTALTVVLDSFFAVVYLTIMFYYSPVLTLWALSMIPLFGILTLVSTPILRNWLNETFNRSADSQSFLVETVTGIHAVKAHTAEKVSRDRWEGLFARFIRTGFKASTTSNISNNIADFLTNLS